MATSPPGRAFDGVSNGMANMTVGSDFGGSGAAGDLSVAFAFSLFPTLFDPVFFFFLHPDPL